jgi:HemY protein
VVRARSDPGKTDFVKANAVPTARIPAILPIVRAPDDPGIEEEEQLPRDEFDEQIAPKAQSSGWFGFLSRFGN